MKSNLNLGFAKVLIVLTLGLTLAPFLFGAEKKMQEKPSNMAKQEPMMAMDTETAVFAGGCFWGMEGIFEQLNGVKDVVSGYSGGDAKSAQYGMVSSGNTGHAESIKITYDPKTIDFETLLKVFFLAAHDPTELNYQGPDEGTQYRSAVFYMNNMQKELTEKAIMDLETKKVYRNKIVTEVTPYKAFYPAEDYHQGFMRMHPDNPYIMQWDAPKVEMLKKKFPGLLRHKGM